jgi:hypothetical protein
MNSKQIGPQKHFLRAVPTQATARMVFPEVPANIADGAVRLADLPRENQASSAVPLRHQGLVTADGAEPVRLHLLAMLLRSFATQL